jgi:CDGSH-type Zn-finger protein
MSGSEKTTINLALNGPYIVNNLMNLSSQKGAVTTDETIALCRCGKSENKPFCDGSHKTIGFTG